MLRRDRLGPALIVSVAGTSLLACAPHPASAPRPHAVVRFTTGPPGGGFYPLGQGLARAYARSLSGATIEVSPSEGAVANVEAIQRGAADPTPTAVIRGADRTLIVAAPAAASLATKRKGLNKTSIPDAPVLGSRDDYS